MIDNATINNAQGRACSLPHATNSNNNNIHRYGQLNRIHNGKVFASTLQVTYAYLISATRNIFKNIDEPKRILMIQDFALALIALMELLHG